MVALKHTIWKEGERAVIFYEGELTAKDGVVEVPNDKPEWIRRAWVLGYRLDPENDSEYLRLEDIPTEDKSAKSEGKKNEGTRSRRRAAS